MENTTCRTCENREHCQYPCKAVNRILWDGNRVMERHFIYGDEKKIVCYPQRNEVHYSELSGKAMDELDQAGPVPWSSGDARLTQTAVFIERFFNNTPCRELAERYGVKENTIVCMYRNAVKSVWKIIQALDARREGLKAVMVRPFTDDQKFFLLCYVFGFNQTEVGRMFDIDHRIISQKVKRMTDRYLEAFSQKPKEETPIDDPPMAAKLTREDVVRLVDAYAEQGLSNLKAFKRIAERQGELLGRSVNPKAIASRYRKTLAAMQGPVRRSAYEGKTLEEIMEMRRF